MNKIIGTRGEIHEIRLILVTIAYYITFKKIKKLEKAKKKLQGTFIPY
ncbi:hypothetical protein [Alkalihalobacillus trypoxylicola]|nr:hypothetical protein [Alkalihalobacillus trypoxylicola]